MGSAFKTRRLYQGAYVHTQSVSSTTWTVNHGLGVQFCSVICINASNKVFQPADVDFSNASTLVVTLAVAGTGIVIVAAPTGFFLWNTDHVNELTAAHGVAIDGLTIKDSGFALGSDADGDTYYRASGALARLPKGTGLQQLRMNSGATAPEWAFGGALVQVVNYQTSGYLSGTGALPVDDTIPQNTEGDELFTLAITPKSATNILVVFIHLYIAMTAPPAAGNITVALFQDSTANALAVTSTTVTGSWNSELNLSHKMAAGTTSSTTFKVRIGNNVGTTHHVNGNMSRHFGGAAASGITIFEIVG